MSTEYREIEQLKTKIGELSGRVAELEASEEERKRVKDALRKTEEQFRLNPDFKSCCPPSFFWFPRF